MNPKTTYKRNVVRVQADAKDIEHEYSSDLLIINKIFDANIKDIFAFNDYDKDDPDIIRHAKMSIGITMVVVDVYEDVNGAYTRSNTFYGILKHVNNYHIKADGTIVDFFVSITLIDPKAHQVTRIDDYIVKDLFQWDDFLAIYLPGDFTNNPNVYRDMSPYIYQKRSYGLKDSTLVTKFYRVNSNTERYGIGIILFYAANQIINAAKYDKFLELCTYYFGVEFKV